MCQTTVNLQKRLPGIDIFFQFSWAKTTPALNVDLTHFLKMKYFENFCILKGTNIWLQKSHNYVDKFLPDWLK